MVLPILFLQQKHVHDPLSSSDYEIFTSLKIITFYIEVAT